MDSTKDPRMLVFKMNLSAHEKHESLPYFDELVRKNFRWSYNFDRYNLSIAEEQIVVIVIRKDAKTINVLYDFKDPETVDLTWNDAKLDPLLMNVRGSALSKKLSI